MVIAKKADTNFKIPETKIDDALMTRANEYVTKTQNAVTEAQTKLNNEKIELAKIDKATKPTEYAAKVEGVASIKVEPLGEFETQLNAVEESLEFGVKQLVECIGLVSRFSTK